MAPYDPKDYTYPAGAEAYPAEKPASPPGASRPAAAAVAFRASASAASGNKGNSTMMGPLSGPAITALPSHSLIVSFQDGGLSSSRLVEGFNGLSGCAAAGYVRLQNTRPTPHVVSNVTVILADHGLTLNVDGNPAATLTAKLTQRDIVQELVGPACGVPVLQLNPMSSTLLPFQIPLGHQVPPSMDTARVHPSSAAHRYRLTARVVDAAKVREVYEDVAMPLYVPPAPHVVATRSGGGRAEVTVRPGRVVSADDCVRVRVRVVGGDGGATAPAVGGVTVELHEQVQLTGGGAAHATAEIARRTVAARDVRKRLSAVVDAGRRGIDVEIELATPGLQPVNATEVAAQGAVRPGLNPDGVWGPVIITHFLVVKVEAAGLLGALGAATRLAEVRVPVVVASCTRKAVCRMVEMHPELAVAATAAMP
ncbi:hypothetical protein DFJ73DRAFT_964988 [Zopfochytrium polystomum]|nr:hypothetical protein DFJ73DRAFT_964988 [Zopfochytrium polystomum]